MKYKGFSAVTFFLLVLSVTVFALTPRRPRVESQVVPSPSIVGMVATTPNGTPNAARTNSAPPNFAATPPKDSTKTSSAMFSPALTLTWTQSFTPADGSPVVPHAVKTLYRRGDGTFVEVTALYQPDGKKPDEDVLVGVDGQGIFRVNDRKKQLEFISPLPEETPDNVPNNTLETLRSSASYVRDDTVSGYSTIVLRYARVVRKPPGKQSDTGNSVSEEAGNASYTEVHYAPELQCTIKTIVVSPGGMFTTEPTDIKIGEPDQKLFNAISDYSVDTTSYEEQIKSAEQHGSPSVVAELREHLRRAKQPKK